MEDRLKTVVTYKTINSTGQVTIDATININDQSQKSASAVLVALLEGIKAVPLAQIGE